MDRGVGRTGVAHRFLTPPAGLNKGRNRNGQPPRPRVRRGGWPSSGAAVSGISAGPAQGVIAERSPGWAKPGYDVFPEDVTAIRQRPLLWAWHVRRELASKRSGTAITSCACGVRRQLPLPDSRRSVLPIGTEGCDVSGPTRPYIPLMPVPMPLRRCSLPITLQGRRPHRPGCPAECRISHQFVLMYHGC